MITKLDLYIFKKFIVRILFLLITISSIILQYINIEMIDNYKNKLPFISILLYIFNHIKTSIKFKPHFSA